MTEEQTTPADAEQDGAKSDELVTPTEHAEAFEGVEPGEDVSDPGVPQDVEVASRSADMDSPAMTHEKVFVLGPGVGNPSKNPYTEANGYDHDPNKLATRQYAIDSGLWPTADVTFKSAKRHPDGYSWILTYSVPVIPAHDAQDGSKTPAVSAAAYPEIDDEGVPTGKTVVEETPNYEPPAEAASEPTE